MYIYNKHTKSVNDYINTVLFIKHLLYRGLGPRLPIEQERIGSD